MTLRLAAVLAAAALAAVAAGCGSSGHVSAGATGTVAGTTYATTVATTVSTTTAANGNACATLRGAASRASSSLLDVLPSFVTVRSRSQLVGKLNSLQHRIAAASSNVSAVSVGSPPLARDKQQLASALGQLSQQVGAARTAVQNGDTAGATHLASTRALHRLEAASSDLASRCAG